MYTKQFPAKHLNWHDLSTIHIVNLNVFRNTIADVPEIRHDSRYPLVVVNVCYNIAATQWLYNVNQRRR